MPLNSRTLTIWEWKVVAPDPIAIIVIIAFVFLIVTLIYFFVPIFTAYLTSLNEEAEQQFFYDKEWRNNNENR